jgi:elongation factor P--(R)-beta-lysine ligase
VNTWQRYKTDEQYRRNIMIRGKVMESIRDFFGLEGFVEIETPLMVAAPGMEPNLSQFKTGLLDERGKKKTAYLVTSPEYSCKKMLAAGMKNIFSLGKVFRNEEPYTSAAGEFIIHNPEFTMLEWYRTGENYLKLMDDTERLVKYCAKIAYEQWTMNNGQNTDSVHGMWSMVCGPWKHVSVKEAFAKIGLNLDEILTRDTMAKAATDKGYAVSSNDSFDDCFFKIFLTEIEPGLGIENPTILYDYPIQMASLSRAKPSDPRYAERFEVYAGGMEIANAFSELTDPVEQRRRLEEERELRGKLGKDQPPVDDDFIEAVGQMPPSAGIALGVDRLVMLLTGAKSIEDVVLFPASELFKEKSDGLDIRN